MRHVRVRLAFVVVTGLLWLAVGCGGGGQQAPVTPPAENTYTSAHFVFHYTSLDGGNIASMAATVEAEYSRIISDLGATSMPTVSYTFFTDHAAMEAAAAPIYVPSWAGGLSTAENRILYMSPNLNPAHYDTGVRGMIHEFSHCVSMHLNAAIANNPRWLWESIALWEAQQFTDPHTLSYMTAHQPPTFDQLNDMNDRRVYEVGYLIGEFVTTHWSQQTLRELILSNGNTVATLGISRAEFETQWFAFVQGKYGI